jgi:release factor glutamine methyltransferase
MSIFDPVVGMLAEQYDLLVSNPPYVSAEEWGQLAPEIRTYEPRLAVSDSGDGYAFYRRMGEVGPSLLRKNGSILVEVGHGQAENVQGIFRDAGFGELSAVNDLQGVPRVVMGTLN